MFDTMTITKVGGALCGALLVFLLLNWVAEGIYSTENGGHGDGAEAAYYIETDEDDAHADGDAEPETVDMVALVAAADIEKGEKVFSKCKACHKLDEGVHGTGPSLFAIVDRDVAAIDGFSYSSGMAALEGSWTIDLLNAFLTKPKDVVAGTKMSFAGLKKDSDRANLIAYLQTTK